MEISFFNSTMSTRQTYVLLRRACQVGCPWNRICWATDYPGFEFPDTLLPKFALVNDVAGEDEPTIPETDMARMLGGNYARFIGIDWSQQQTVEQMRGLEESWRQTIKEKKVR